jgi:hypothetical protein
MHTRKFLLGMAVPVLAALAVVACSSGHSGTAGSAPAESQPSAKTASHPSTNATPVTAGGSFCDVVKTSHEAMRPLSHELYTRPTNTEADWDGIMKEWRTMAGAAPPELRDDFRVIVDAWNRAGDQAAKAGWDFLALIRALSQEMDGKAFQQAYEHQAGYIHDRCGFDPFDPASPA